MNAKSLSGYFLSFLVGGALSYFLFKDSKNTISEKSLPEAADSESFVKMLSPRGILGLVDTATAHPNMRAHADNNGYAELHRHNSAKVKTVLHDTTEFRNYMNTTFGNFTKTHTPAKGYVWQIGAYPMIFKQRMEGSDKPRLSFYFIPTLVLYENNKIKRIVDYMYAIKNDTFKVCYVRNLHSINPAANVYDDKYIFDEGQLWP